MSSHAKQVIANVYARNRIRFPEKSVRDIFKVVSEDTGVSPRTVAKYKAARLCGPLTSPKRRPRDVKISSTRTVKHDSFTIHAIRLKVHGMYARKEIPTLESAKVCQRRRRAPELQENYLVEVVEEHSVHVRKKKTESGSNRAQ